MIIIKRNKIAAVWLLIVLAIGFSYGSGGEILWERQKASATLTISNSPRVGEVFTVTYTFTSHVEPESADIFFYPHIVKFSIYTHTHPNAYKVIKGQIENKLPRLGKEESAEFNISLIITEPAPMIHLGTGVPGHIGWSKRSQYYLIDDATGQYGTSKEYEETRPVEYRYDPLTGTFTCSPSKNPAPVEENLKIIKMIKQLEPALSDSEALLLHSEEYLTGVPKDVAQWDEKNKRWTEEKVYEYYLKDGWYKAFTGKALDQWRIKEKKKIEDTWKESRLNFFRPSTDSINSNPHRLDRVTKTFDGYWKFKDHVYNKNQGLLAQAIKKPIYQG